ncbi:delta-1-pyrroline-5-carboxylate synthase B-like [Hibiscus syriacus]|uniref:delta-1-pyrroline-5-carboxylate synthase B-like n=1 Tax=Hibiscus syriacus TaxID=106335 RepID=UPI0019229FF0|nr:delta-1-pyrroline-5-carboxylate synthase B-like [Hibiscus syriacus]
METSTSKNTEGPSTPAAEPSSDPDKTPTSLRKCTRRITLYGGPRASSLLKLPETQSLHHEYSSLACTVDIVDDVEAAIGHIHQYGSSHTNAIVTDDLEVAETFLHRVDIAAVFHSKCTRFCDGARFGLGAEVGVTSMIHA